MNETSPSRLPAAAELKAAMQQEVSVEHAIAVSAEAVAKIAAGHVLGTLAQAHATIDEIEQVPTWDVPADKQFFSTGSACQFLQIAPPEFHLAMQHAGVKFVEKRNEVPYIDGVGILALNRYLKQLRAAEQE